MNEASIIAPLDFREAVEHARSAEQRGDLNLLAWECRGFEWESEGLRLIGRARLELEANERTAAGKAKAPRVLLFTGHMIDKPGREPRFPNTPAAEAQARRMIRDEVVKEQALANARIVGISGGACGADILFHEICAELNIPTELYLALPPDQFCVTSVAHAGPDWIERFEALYKRLAPHVLGNTEELPVWLRAKPNYGIWQRNNLWMLFNALAKNSEDLTLIALWDRGKADGPGGTEDLVAQVRQRGQKALILPAERLREFQD